MFGLQVGFSLFVGEVLGFSGLLKCGFSGFAQGVVGLLGFG